MLCEQCLQNSADVLLTRFAAGTLSSVQLCRACAGPILDEIEPDEITGATFLSPEGASGSRGLPEGVHLPSSMTVRELAAALRLEPYQVVATLARLHVFAAAVDTLDFAVAASVCSIYGVNVLSSVA